MLEDLFNDSTKTEPSNNLVTLSGGNKAYCLADPGKGPGCIKSRLSWHTGNLSPLTFFVKSFWNQRPLRYDWKKKCQARGSRKSLLGAKPLYSREIVVQGVYSCIMMKRKI